MTQIPENVKSAIKCGPKPLVRDWRSLPVSELTRAERNMSFAEKYLVVPEGKHVGKPIRLSIFQEVFFYCVFDNPSRTRRAYLSKARKNAKTATIAIILLCFLIGPEAKQNSNIESGAMSRKQAGQVFRLAKQMVEASKTLAPLVHVIPSTKTMIGLPLNVTYTAVAAEGKTAHGSSPALVILDETGQIKGPQSDFVDAMVSSQGAHDDPLLIVISTQAANDADLLSVWLDDAIKSQDPRIVCHLYTAPMDAELDDRSAWEAANPALGVFLNENELIEGAKQAKRMPSSESMFRNLHLNQRVSAVSPFVSKSVWEQNSGEPDPDKATTWFAGLDLSARTDLTAFVMAGLCEDGSIQVSAHFWTPADGIVERSKRDRAPYDMWAQQGLINTTPGRTVDYEYVARDIADIIDGLNVHGIAFDRWRIDVLKKEFERLGFEPPLVEFGQGYKDMAPALDEMEAALLNGRLRHGGNPVMQMCAANAVVVKDPAGGRKLDKSKATGRIDGMVALAMAVGASTKAAPEAEPEYTLMVL